MKLTSAFVTLAALVSVGANAQQCSSYVIRKEIRSLSTSEWSRISTVVKLLQDSGWFTWFAYLHTSNFGTIHGCEYFLPWHRRFLKDFESIGQMYDKNFAMPYWDTLRDYARPSSSAVLTSKYIGTNGKGNKCVTDGNQANWRMEYPSGHCLQREYNNGQSISAWQSPEYMQSIMSRSTKMSQLRPAFEYSIHGSVHLALGGDMVMDWSPNDFAFWLHHANIDRLWFVWQMQNPAQNFWSIEGVDITGKSLTYGSPIPYYNDNLLSLMQPGYNNMCFYYDNGSAVSRKRSLPNKRDERKCIPRPVAPIPPLNEGVFDNVNEVPVASDTYVKDTIVSNLPSDMLDKWFPTYTTVPATAQNGTDYSAIPAPPPLDASVYSSSSVEDINTSTDEDTDYSDVDDYVSDESSSDYASDDYSAVAIPTDDGKDDDSNQGIYSEAYQMYDTEENPDAYGIDGVGPKYPMPNPFPLSAHWVQMHKLSPEEIHEHYAQAKEFVKDLNGAGYQSPYAKPSTGDADATNDDAAAASSDAAESDASDVNVVDPDVSLIMAPSVPGLAGN
ncbi:hypothetical protein IWW45_004198 [Coemansia sp. RSA 485]|nr:hypothetical protein IWW45_004198 [Coemansia sp. RSA 485]